MTMMLTSKTGLRGLWRGATVAALLLAAGPAMAQKGLVSAKATQPPVIDGTVDAAWEKAAAYKVSLEDLSYKPSNGYKGITKASVTLKSLYDAEHIYLLVQWEDPTRSVERGPWVKQPDGKWMRLKSPDSTGHENTYYEDKLALLWNINTANFDKKGCAIACHKARGGKNAGVDVLVVDLAHGTSADALPVPHVQALAGIAGVLVAEGLALARVAGREAAALLEGGRADVPERLLVQSGVFRIRSSEYERDGAPGYLPAGPHCGRQPAHGSADDRQMVRCRGICGYASECGALRHVIAVHHAGPGYGCMERRFGKAVQLR
jgi:hypothetical protein